MSWVRKLIGWYRGTPYLDDTEMRVLTDIRNHPEYTMADRMESLGLSQITLVSVMCRLTTLGFVRETPPKA